MRNRNNHWSHDDQRLSNWSALYRIRQPCSLTIVSLEALNHGRCYNAFQIKDLICYFMTLKYFTLKSAPSDLKCGFTDFPLIGVRAAPDSKVILRPLEQNLAPERYKYMDTLRGRSGADCFACRIMTAVGWMKPDAPRREDRKEKPLLAWGRGRSPERELSLRAEF